MSRFAVVVDLEKRLALLSVVIGVLEVASSKIAN
jgi:hypothetical protein